MALLLRDATFYGHNPSQTDFFYGTGASALVPDTFHVSIDGHPYMVDFNQPFYRQYRRQIAQLIRTQADTSKEPSEQSLDPNSLWRRSFEDWLLGANQRYLDRTDSVDNSFWQSKGIDISTKWQISLLPDTQQLRSTANTNLQVVVAGPRVYAIDGQNLYYTTALGAPSTWTQVTGTPAVTASSITTDGYDIWVAYGADGIYTTNTGSGAATQYSATAIDAAAVLGYVNERLMLASTNNLYNLVASGALPSALLTTGNPNARFVAFAEGNNALYAAGNVGGKAFIWGISVDADGTALSAPIVEGELPFGETVSSIQGYLGFLVVGTSQGVRMCTVNSTAGITLGALIPTPAAVQCLTAWGRWVWFGWSTYDGVSSGLGRIDLQNQVISGVLPAVVSDLMVTTQLPVTSVAAFNGQMCFAVAGLGLYGPQANLVASGTITSGYILYDLADPKVACLIDVQTVGPLAFGSYSAALSTDGGAFNPLGTHTAGQFEPVTFGCGFSVGQRFEVQFTLNRDANTTTAGPALTRWTLRSYPAPNRPLTWQIPIVMSEEVIDASGANNPYDPLAEVEHLEGLAMGRRMVTFQEGSLSYPVFVQDVSFLPDYSQEAIQLPSGGRWFNGLVLVTLVGLPPGSN